MKPRLFDIHSHLNDSAFDQDQGEVIARMKERDLWTITVGTDREMSKKAAELTLKGEGLFATIGMHPTDNTKEGFDTKYYNDLAITYPKVVAIGECGLDYFRTPHEKLQEEKKRQFDLFEKQIELAVGLDLPLMIHCRDAHQDILDILESKKKEYGDRLRGDIHFFADTIETAKRYLDIDFTMSFTGVITFAPEYHEVVKYLPLSHIMSETDAPYVAPVPYRGKRCEPLYVEEVVKKIAEIRKEPIDVVQKMMVDNAFRVFCIDSKL
jgi:TatD DNase family protein